METSWYTFTHPNRATLYLLYTSVYTGELNVIRKHECFLKSNVRTLTDFLRTLNFADVKFNVRALTVFFVDVK